MTKVQLLAYLTIGNLIAAVLWNFPVNAWDLETWVRDSVNGVHDSLSPGKSEAQTPLAVPQMEPPIGNSGNQAIQPCAAPPPVPVATRTVEPSPVRHSPSAGRDRFKDRKAKILMNLAPGNQISSIYSRLHSPDSTDLAPSQGGIDDFWATRDGLIKVSHKDGLVTSIQFVGRSEE